MSIYSFCQEMEKCQKSSQGKEPVLFEISDKISSVSFKPVEKI